MDLEDVFKIVASVAATGVAVTQIVDGDNNDDDDD